MIARSMYRSMKGFTLFWALCAAPSGIVVAQDDSSSRDPLAFEEAIEAAKGVILRVPINASGQEDTNRAEMRFVSEYSRVDQATNAANLWNQASSVEASDEFLGTNGPQVDPRHDSPTWGWYYWNHRGWGYPYYYYSYYPTFYYNYSWHYYRPYYYWNWGYYRYYYYAWW